MKKSCGLCNRYGRGCQYHPDEEASESVTGADLSPQQLLAIESLVARGATETLADVAKRANVTPRTLYRYLQNAEFVNEFRKRVEGELGAYRAKVAAALVRGAITAGPGQAAMQRIFWQRLGELVEKQERTGADGGPIITKIERVIVYPDTDARNNSG